MEELIQSSLLKKTTFEIKEDKLHIQSKGIFNSIEYDLSFEDISEKVVYETKMADAPKLAIVCGIIFMVISILNKDAGMIILAIFTSVLIFGLIYATRKRTATILLFDNRVIVLNQKSPDPDAVKQFIGNLQAKIRGYLKSKYGTIDRDLPFEPQLNNLTWLKNRNVINEEEFNVLKNSLLRNSSNKKVGF